MKAIPLDLLEATSATQVRVRLHPDVIEDYAESMKNGAIFPPVVVFAEEGSERYILADGFHRLAAAKKAGKKDLLVSLRIGGMDEALDFALSANETNGVRRTNADKVNAVMIAIQHPRHKDKSSRDIAELCCVSKSTVNNIRQGLNEAKKAIKTEKKPAPKPVESKEPATEAVRPTREPLTQAAIDRNDFLAACRAMRAFPYAGSEAAERMELKDEDEDVISFAEGFVQGALNSLLKQGEF